MEEKAKSKKEGDEAKKAAAELTARLEALEVEAKAKKEVSKVQSKVLFSFVPSLSSGQVWTMGESVTSAHFRLETGTGTIIVPPVQL